MITKIKSEIRPVAVPGTHGRMLSKTIFEVRELIPHPKAPDLFINGRSLFKGGLAECEKWVSEHEE
jgi:hypothetical protein